MLTNAARHPARLTRRAAALAVDFLAAAWDWWTSPGCRVEQTGGPCCAQWLTRHSRRMLRTLRVRVEWSGPVPDRGLLVANHVSYLDILALGAMAPATFVAKSEVRSWPLIHAFVKMAGTLWGERHRRSATDRTVAEIRGVVSQGGLITLFPEGTSSAGRRVLPFRPALLEPACGAQQIWIAHIQYTLEDGAVEQDVAYWGEASFLPHLANLLTKREIRARVRCACVPVTTTDRKQLARSLQRSIECLAGEC